MTKHLTLVLVPLGLLITPLIARPALAAPVGQQASAATPLTNDDVIKMVQAKLGDAVIVAKIKSSICKFDTSTDALIRLKGSGVGDAVLAAMAECGTTPAGTSAAPTSAPPPAVPAPDTTSVPGLPTQPGAYFKDPAKGWARLEQTPAPQTRTKMGKMAVVGPFAKGHAMVTYRGADAPIQIGEHNPTFYLRNIGSPRDVVIVKLDKKKDRREISVAQVGGFAGLTSGYEEKARREVSVAQISNGLLSVTPKASLDPGEYLLDTGGGTYDFGINPPK